MDEEPPKQTITIKAKKKKKVELKKDAPKDTPIKIKIKPKPKKKRIQDNIELDINDKTYNENLRENEKKEHDILEKNEDLNIDLYPNLNDPNFTLKIAKKKEFSETQYEGNIANVEAMAEKMCNEERELAPHQIFVRNFLSFNTPYNSLLLYHGLGSGKTCAAVGIMEENRNYFKQLGIKKKYLS